jgi:transposase
MRYDLTDFEWSIIEPSLAQGPSRPQAKQQPPGSQPYLPGLRAGAPWRDLPERYGPYTTAYNRFNRWRKAGIRDRLMDGIVKAHDAGCR